MSIASKDTAEAFPFEYSPPIDHSLSIEALAALVEESNRVLATTRGGLKSLVNETSAARGYSYKPTIEAAPDDR